MRQRPRSTRGTEPNVSIEHPKQGDRSCAVLSIVALTLVSAVSAALARTWTDTSGKFSIEAELVQVEEGKVQLRKPDGSLVTVPLAKLSDGDRRYLESREKAVPAAPAAPRFGEGSASGDKERSRRQKGQDAAVARQLGGRHCRRFEQSGALDIRCHALEGRDRLFEGPVSRRIPA